MKSNFVKVLGSVVLTTIIATGIVFASKNIDTLNQTAVTGDKITANWVNAVNSKVNAVGESNIQCTTTAPNTSLGVDNWSLVTACVNIKS